MPPFHDWLVLFNLALDWWAGRMVPEVIPLESPFMISISYVLMITQEVTGLPHIKCSFPIGSI